MNSLPRRPNRWAVHIGAHKTATTHFQKLLEFLKQQAEAEDIRIFATSEIRQYVRRANGRQGPWRRSVDHRWIRHKAIPKLQNMTQGLRTAVYSDEDTLGYTQDLFENRFYPNLSGLALPRWLAAGSDLEIFVSIRSYDRLVESAYFELLKSFPNTQEIFDKGLSNLDSNTFGWVDLFSRIQEELPNAVIRFWCQENYSKNTLDILSAVLGTRVSELPNVEPSASNRSPSNYAIKRARELDPSLPMKERQSQVRKIFAEYPRLEGATERLISPSVSENLKSLYECHLVELRRRYKEVGA